MLPWWELSFYLLASVGFHVYSFYEVYTVSRGKVPALLNLCQESKVGRECWAVGAQDDGLRAGWLALCSAFRPSWAV